MQELYNIGISESSIKEMIELNPEIIEMSNNEILEKINILGSINCTNDQIVNIISSNAMYLSRITENVINLLKYLYEARFKLLNTIVDANPYVLNLDVFEVEDYINNRINNGEDKESILDDIESNPYLFNEM